MGQYRTCMIASAGAAAISLTGCGGGSSGVGSTPPPPTSTPTPTPSPNMIAATITAPLQASVPSSHLFPVATTGGATIQAHSMATFPLVQTVVSIGPGVVKADAASIDGGASLAFSSSTNAYTLDVANPALGVSNLVLHPSNTGSLTWFEEDLPGDRLVAVNIVNPATSGLSWTTYGFWDVHVGDKYTNAPFATGYATQVASVPSSGSATYHGSVVGESYHPGADGIDGVYFYHLSGDATLQANFASGTITGDLTNMITTGFEGDIAPWNSVSLSGDISGGQFGGTTAATSGPTNSGSLDGSATGTFAGMFFGPGAQELGAVWTLHDGTSSAIGAIGATTNSSGYWDY